MEIKDKSSQVARWRWVAVADPQIWEIGKAGALYCYVTSAEVRQAPGSQEKGRKRFHNIDMDELEHENFQCFFGT